MRIVNVGDKVVNTWVYQIPEGYVMIDTGYPGKLGKVSRRLARHRISWAEIRYVFLTHAHDDHAGFLNDLLKKHPHIKVVMNLKSLASLQAGHSLYHGVCTSEKGRFFFRSLALLGHGKNTYPPLEDRFISRLLIITKENREDIEKRLHGKIILTPGHTGDSICLRVGKRLFCGDTAMNGFPSTYRIPVWVEDIDRLGRSWDTILGERGSLIIHPGHGKPFGRADLAQFRDVISELKVWPLEKRPLSDDRKKKAEEAVPEAVPQDIPECAPAEAVPAEAEPAPKSGLSENAASLLAGIKAAAKKPAQETGPDEEHFAQAAESAPAEKSRLADAAAKLNSFRGESAERFSAFMEKASGKAGPLKEKAADKAGSLRERASDKAGSVKESVADKAGSLRKGAAKAGRKAAAGAKDGFEKVKTLDFWPFKREIPLEDEYFPLDEDDDFVDYDVYADEEDLVDESVSAIEADSEC